MFFGREEEVVRSVNRLIDHGFLAVVGASGIGKTSLVRAGIIPALKANRVSVFDPITSLRFGGDPITTLATVLGHIPDRGSDGRPLLFIDQFEELYTVVDAVDRENILHEIVALTHDDRLALIIALRSDFFSRLIETPDLAQKTELSAMFLAPMSQANVRRAIIAPARLSGIQFEEKLVDRLVADVGSDSASLPLLQLQLYNLVLDDQDGVVTLSDYERQGAGHGALGRVLDIIWNSAQEADRPRIQSLMLRLVTPEMTRRAVALDDFPIDDQQHINRLVAARVLRVHQDPTSGKAILEITHEAILTQWPRFARWVEEEREFLKRRERLSGAAMLWAGANRDSAYLLLGGALSQAREFLENRPYDLTVLERSFIEQSISAKDRSSAWKALSRGLGFGRLEKEIIDRDERRSKIQDELASLEQQLRLLEDRKSQVTTQLEEWRREISNAAPKVFLSYAREDFPQVKPLYDELKQQGLSPWLDREDLLPGVDWDREIDLQIKQSHFVLFCVSRRSLNKRGYVQRELRTALRAFEEIPSGQTYLIPVRLEECAVPDELSKYQFADVFREGEFKRLLKSIFIAWAQSKERSQL